MHRGDESADKQASKRTVKS